MILVIFFASSIVFSCLPFLHSATGDHNTSMSSCPESFTCPYPSFSPFKYPFYYDTDSQCGLIKANCNSTGGKIQLGGDSYEIVRKVLSELIVTIHNTTFKRLVKNSSCKALMNNFTSPSPLLYSISIAPVTTLYKCTNHPNDVAKIEAYFHQSNYSSYNRCKHHNFYYNYSIGDTAIPSDLPPTCQVIRLPVDEHKVVNKTNIFSLLSPVFTLYFHTPCDYKCLKEEGLCHIPNGRPSVYTPKKLQKKKDEKKRKLILVLAGSSFLILFLIIFIIWRWYKRNPFSYFSSKDRSRHVEDGTHFYGVSVFSYTELEDATQNFDPSQELGNGGFGAVYYGKLQDGREVAVKRLYEHNYKRVQQFINEIQILTGLRHPNLVVLYGCTSRQSHELLLVYEYISNGTLADHLHGELANQSLLTWSLRMNIAIETARALVYLHASEIIHRDVKTSNILLDQNFSTKVADFGLSRLIPNDVTHVSTAPQGTP